MDEATRAYIAGVMDCDGSFMVVGRPDGKRFEPRVAVAQVTPQIPLFMQQHFQGDIQLARLEPPRRDRYMWRTSCMRAIKVCECCLPYLLVKKPRAEALLELRDLMDDKFKTYSYWYEKKHPNWAAGDLITTLEAQKIIGYRNFDSVKQAIRMGVLLALPGKGGSFMPRIPREMALWLAEMRGSSSTGRLPTTPYPLVDMRRDIWKRVRQLNKRGC